MEDIECVWFCVFFAKVVFHFGGFFWETYG